LTVRIWSADQLEKEKGSDVVNTLVKALNEDKFWGVRAACASALGNLKTTRHSRL